MELLTLAGLQHLVSKILSLVPVPSSTPDHSVLTSRKGVVGWENESVSGVVIDGVEHQGEVTIPTYTSDGQHAVDFTQGATVSGATIVFAFGSAVASTAATVSLTEDGVGTMTVVSTGTGIVTVSSGSSSAVLMTGGVWATSDVGVSWDNGSITYNASTHQVVLDNGHEDLIADTVANATGVIQQLVTTTAASGLVPASKADALDAVIANGVVVAASQAEVNAGVVSNKFVAPSTLLNYIDRTVNRVYTGILMHFDGSCTDECDSPLYDAVSGAFEYEAGVFGQALTMNSVNLPHVALGADVISSAYTDFTLECRLKAGDQGSGGHSMPMRFGNTFSWNNGGAYQLMVDRADTGAGVQVYYDHLTNSSQYLRYPVSINDGQFHHIVVQQKGTTVKLLVDGLMRDSAQASSALSTSFYLEVGRVSDGSQYYFTGAIDEVRVVFGKALYADTYTVPTAPFTLDD